MSAEVGQRHCHPAMNGSRNDHVKRCLAGKSHRVAVPEVAIRDAKKRGNTTPDIDQGLLMLNTNRMVCVGRGGEREKPGVTAEIKNTLVFAQML